MLSSDPQLCSTAQRNLDGIQEDSGSNTRKWEMSRPETGFDACRTLPLLKHSLLSHGRCKRDVLVNCRQRLAFYVQKSCISVHRSRSAGALDSSAHGFSEPWIILNTAVRRCARISARFS